jgi:hypothetical protein
LAARKYEFPLRSEVFRLFSGPLAVSLPHHYAAPGKATGKLPLGTGSLICRARWLAARGGWSEE